MKFLFDYFFAAPGLLFPRIILKSTAISIVGFFLLLGNYEASAQFVSIPDPFMVNWLQSNYPNCITGSQLDTTCADLGQSNVFLNAGPISDLTGIEWAEGLTYVRLDSHFTVQSVPQLPNGIKTLIYGVSVPFAGQGSWPDSLRHLEIYNYNQAMPALPDSLEYVFIFHGNYPDLPTLNDALDSLYLEFLSGMDTLRNLPAGLKYLNLQYTFLDSIIGGLPDSLRHFYALGSRFNTLPALPVKLANLELPYCSSLIHLPPLPPALTKLNVSFTNVSDLPALPYGIRELRFSETPITCLPYLPSSLFSLIGHNTGVRCLPNRPRFLSPFFQNYPLCEVGDAIDNPDQCPEFARLKGRIFLDHNQNCSFDGAADDSLFQVKISVYDDQGQLYGAAYTDSAGFYTIGLGEGTYEIVVDSTVIPLASGCSLFRDSVTMPPYAGVVIRDFAYQCATGVDLRVGATVVLAPPVPGTSHSVYVVAQDNLAISGANCGASPSATLTVVLEGPIQFVGASAGALVPQVFGDTLIYNVADFSLVDPQTDFSFELLVDQTALPGDLICIESYVSSVSGPDLNPMNNTAYFCYALVGGLSDLNKDVFPTEDVPGSTDFLIYTIRFQNIDTSTVQNIRIKDELSSFLDHQTFEFLAASHAVQVNQFQNIIRFDFDNINLPDSAIDAVASRGYVSFRIRPKSNSWNGMTIANRAEINLDEQGPAFTNYAFTEYRSLVSVEEKGAPQVKLYPNPGTGDFQLWLDQLSTFEQTTLKVFSSTGQLIKDKKFEGAETRFSINDHPAGFYLVRIEGNDWNRTMRLVKL